MKKMSLVERIQGLLFKCDVRYLRHALRDLKDYIKDNPIYDILFDPQTSGGLLICVDEDKTTSLIQELKDFTIKNIKKIQCGKIVTAEIL